MGSRGNKAFKLITISLLITIIISIFYLKFSEESPTERIIPPVSLSDKQLVEQKWQKDYMSLPTAHLVIISPHNEAIQSKFETAFVKKFALDHGKRVLIWWHQLGGSNAIMDFLTSQRQQNRSKSLDLVFGGGEYLFRQLADRDMLAPLTLADDVLTNIPPQFAGVQLYDSQLRWCGNVLSGFGFIYDNQVAASLGVTELNTWSDLASPALFEQIAIADPKYSGSTVVAMEMILQSEPDWQTGWKTLLGVVSNSDEFMSSSEDAANAPVFSQTAAAICIDFYGMARQAIDPEKVTYITPKNQTAFTPDPIAILKDAPNAEVAKAFVDFVLSLEGQALWSDKGDASQKIYGASLHRTPIRKDSYTKNAAAMSPTIKNPYELADTFHLDSDLRTIRYDVLRKLVYAAAVKNLDLMQQAKQKLIDSQFDESLASEFYKLPENVDTIDELRSISSQLEDPDQAEDIVYAWSKFFKYQYRKVLE